MISLSFARSFRSFATKTAVKKKSTPLAVTTTPTPLPKTNLSKKKVADTPPVSIPVVAETPLPSDNNKPATKAPRPYTGLNLFVKEKTSTDPKITLPDATKLWKNLSENEKDSWKTRAKNFIPPVKPVRDPNQPRAPRLHMSGYNLFIQDYAKAHQGAPDLLKNASLAYKALSESDKKQLSDKAMSSPLPVKSKEDDKKISAWRAFVSEVGSTLKGDNTQRGTNFKKLAEMYSKLSETEKDKYVKAFEQKKQSQQLK